jgi:hypothetical protein
MEWRFYAVAESGRINLGLAGVYEDSSDFLAWDIQLFDFSRENTQNLLFRWRGSRAVKGNRL